MKSRTRRVPHGHRRAPDVSFLRGRQCDDVDRLDLGDICVIRTPSDLRFHESRGRVVVVPTAITLGESAVILGELDLDHGATADACRSKSSMFSPTDLPKMFAVIS